MQPRSGRVWIVEIIASSAVLAKINQKHNVTLEEVREAALLGAADQVAWHNHPERGWRLLVKGKTADGQPLNIVLYPDENDEERFYLGTAMRQ